MRRNFPIVKGLVVVVGLVAIAAMVRGDGNPGIVKPRAKGRGVSDSSESVFPSIETSPARVAALRKVFPALGAVESSTGEGMRVGFPESYVDGVRLEYRACILRQRLIGARGGVPVERGGWHVYEGVLDGVDAIVTGNSTRMEEFLHVHFGGAESVRYEITIESPGFRFHLEQPLAIVDVQEAVVLRLMEIRYWRAGETGEGRSPEVRIETPEETRAVVEIRFNPEDAGQEILLDPAWVSAQSMAHARSRHTTTMLADGTVLVAGGRNSAGFLSSCELFDPSRGTWSPGTKLPESRSDHTSTLLSDGTVIVTGGRASSFTLMGSMEVPLGSCRKYDPRARAWAAIPSMATARAFHAATRVPCREHPGCDKIVVTGGAGSSGVVSTCEVFDRTLCAWSSGGVLNQARAAHTATLLSSGEVFVTGGFAGSSQAPIASSERLDPYLRKSLSASPLARARSFHTATTLRDNRILIAGGGGDSEIYDTMIDRWSAPIPMTSPRSGHTSILLRNGDVLVAGGQNAGVAQAACEAFQSATGRWSSMPSLAVPRSNHSALLLPTGSILVVGGEAAKGGTTSSEVYSPADGRWVTGRPSPDWVKSVTPLPTGKILVVFGSSCELYDPKTISWSSTASMNLARSGHTATLLSNGLVLIAGGGPRECELYNPWSESWTLTGRLAVQRSWHSATRMKEGRVLIAGGVTTVRGEAYYVGDPEIYDPAAGVWTSFDAYPWYIRRHTATLLPSGSVLLAEMETGSCYLFEPSTNGVRSTAMRSQTRGESAAALLPNGKVLVSGGYDSSGQWAASELFDSSTESWTSAGRLPLQRQIMTVLPDGKVLAAHGYLSDVSYLFDPATGVWTETAGGSSPVRYEATVVERGFAAPLTGPGSVFLVNNDRAFSYEDGPFSPAFKPLIASINGSTGCPAQLKGGGSLSIQGARLSGTQGGDGTSRSSATAAPVVRLVSFPSASGEGSGQQWNLEPFAWSDSFISTRLPAGTDLSEGYYYLFVIVGGIVGEGKIVRISR